MNVGKHFVLMFLAGFITTMIMIMIMMIIIIITIKKNTRVLEKPSPQKVGLSMYSIERDYN